MRPIRYLPPMVDEFVRQGHWTNETFYDFYQRNAAERPDREALVDSNYRVTWAEAARLVDAIAAAWIDDGLPRDARVIVQAPNSVYGFLARIACERAGLISLTAYPYLRQAELEYMVEQTQASMAVIPRRYRDFDYLAMYRELMGRFPSLTRIYLFDAELPSAAAVTTLPIQPPLSNTFFKAGAQQNGHRPGAGRPFAPGPRRPPPALSRHNSTPVYHYIGTYPTAVLSRAVPVLACAAAPIGWRRAAAPPAAGGHRVPGPPAAHCRQLTVTLACRWHSMPA